MKKQKFVPLAVIATIISLIGINFALDNKSADVKEVQNAYLEVTSGTVLINGQEVQNSGALQVGDRIETQDQSGGEIIYFDNSISRLSSNTKVIINSLESNNYDLGQGKIALKIEEGRVWSKVEKRLSPEFNFEVTTNSVNATIRGSALDVFTDGQCRSSFVAAEHSAELTTNKTKKLINEGERAEVVSPDCPNETEGFKIAQLGTEELNSAWYQENLQIDQGLHNQREIRLAKGEVKLVASMMELGEEDFLARYHKVIKAYKNEDEKEANKLLLELKKELDSKAKKEALKIIYQGKKLVNNLLPNQKAYPLKVWIHNQEIINNNNSELIAQEVVKSEILDLYDYSKKGSDKKELATIISNFSANQVARTKSFDLEDTIREALVTNYYLARLLDNKQELSAEEVKLTNQRFLEEEANFVGVF
jgi:hypothetical protein